MVEIITEGTVTIKKLLWHSTEDFREKTLTLLQKGTIDVKILKDIDYNTLSPHANNVIWTLLYYGDYFTINENENLRIPNTKLTSNRKAGNRHFDIRIIPITEDVIYLISAILEIKVCKKNKNSDEYEYVDELSSDEEIKYGNENEIKHLLKDALSNELFLEDKLVKVDLQCNDSSAWHPVLNGLTENLEACFQLKAQHVRFTISHSILIPDELSNEGSLAFNFMMTQQRLKKLPLLYNSQFRNDLLYNDFLKILQERKLGWLNDNHLTIGHSFICRVTDLVWYFDPHLGKFEKRGLKLPKIIAKLPVYASESHYNLYHDTTKHKKIEISREKLESFVKALILSIQQPWTRLLHWEEVIKDIDDLIKIAQEYANYLQGVNNRMRTIHTSLVPVRNGRDGYYS
ncbi:hypothetical protein GLOIN_2v1870994 [Rhizophagus irregularis DAOM 181602=DAOM 197198]|uniref:Uncharacterized protein n=1 Tax=Rhizophagus irregularis (strain DAOM 181602 / DAOM 197198 / MUCL 43194) TaxID=747089 RepID=A0A2P4QJJ1_RHIID|nr:hypothetical protein GLOIN_2v1870994 [Rhizophagus irregularis DAOM 181602=DAOM 197198]POG77768.1 hypothetical protein GLOIN_2v1870994 [Rhizophagus irregularis DAOM 181602=DAOM 197198]|eukprot:XP_025184634.1 hypothetical protein GLOIN_2v1870994 [Rhizophagus irregularis DAOM 181602=DAOM 197198]